MDLILCYLMRELKKIEKYYLYILFTPESIINSINVKNDKNITFRAIEGIYEVHKFFIGINKLYVHM